MFLLCQEVQCPVCATSWHDKNVLAFVDVGHVNAMCAPVTIKKRCRNLITSERVSERVSRASRQEHYSSDWQIPLKGRSTWWHHFTAPSLVISIVDICKPLRWAVSLYPVFKEHAINHSTYFMPHDQSTGNSHSDSFLCNNFPLWHFPDANFPGDNWSVDISPDIFSQKQYHE